ncbi:hypothetical protein KIW84_012240 [Lathyrus oleraceus]|uniref:Uncharacterized protein n=1 Tax=Pisum sativum TaxID=3888 RepID=A0A9D5GVZ6_PEA|nr:hypothetical protein KIW84_012240 [Pisum sativum]
MFKWFLFFLGRPLFKAFNRASSLVKLFTQMLVRHSAVQGAGGLAGPVLLPLKECCKMVESPTCQVALSVDTTLLQKLRQSVPVIPTPNLLRLAANHSGTYLVGGGLSGEIYLSEVETGKLLKKWHGHYRKQHYSKY